MWAGVPPLRDLKYINRVNSSPCKQHWLLCGVLQVFNLIPQKEHFGTRSGCGLYVSVHPVAIPPGAADLSLRGAMFYFKEGQAFQAGGAQLSLKCLENK